MNNKRIIAIENEILNETSTVNHLVEEFMKNGCTSEVYVFTRGDAQKFNIESGGVVCRGIAVPKEKDTRSKFKNYLRRWFKDNGYTGKLHIIEDVVELKQNPISFISDIERMMDVYGLNNWCDTFTDTCNFVYSKYNPRLDVVIDRPEFSRTGIQNAVFCSHSNVQWNVCNLERADDNELYFDEDFSVDMFFIIEFLARRRATHPNSLYFMNQYYTCSSEKGVFQVRPGAKRDELNDVQEVMKKEDGVFKAKNVNYAPDNNIDIVLERLYETLKRANGQKQN